jgi:hypothetical protein
MHLGPESQKNLIIGFSLGLLIFHVRWGKHNR